MIRGIFVDFGNTLASDEEDKKLHLLFCEEIKKKYSIPKEPEEINDFLSSFVKGSLFNSHKKWPGLLKLYTNAFVLLLNTSGRPAIQEDINYFQNLFLEYHFAHTKFYEGAIETLSEMKEKGLYVGMISDNDNDILHGILERQGIKHLFEHIITSEDVGVGKPNEKIFKKALSLVPFKPEECVYIGNSEFHDVEGAKKVGMLPLHFTGTYKTWKEVREKLLELMGEK